MAHVVALDAKRRLGQAEMLLEIAQGSGTGVVIGGPTKTMTTELLCGVMHDSRHELPLVAALGHPDRDSRTALVTQPLLIEIGLRRWFSHQYLLGHTERRDFAVEAFEHPIDEFPGSEVLSQIQHEASPTNHASAAHMEHLHRGFEIIAGESDDVEILLLLQNHLLLFDNGSNRSQTIAKSRGAFELKLIARLLHLGLKAIDNRISVTLEELNELTHHRVVVVA
jgi:hypothetical protein